jgi:hypothetical protein
MKQQSTPLDIYLQFCLYFFSFDKNLEDNGQANETQDFDETIIYAFGDVSIKNIVHRFRHMQ